MAEVIQEKHIEPRKFTIRVMYFKDNGKYYTEGEYEWKGRVVGDAHPTVYMPDVVAQVRGWRDNGGQGALPGLNAETSGWDGYITVDCEEGYPWLILPPKAG